MKSQISLKTISLLAAVLFIWGTISWRLYQSISAKEEPMMLQVPLVQNNKLDSPRLVSYPLSLNYSDPFLAKSETSTRIKKPVTSFALSKGQSFSVSRFVDLSRFVYKGVYFNKNINSSLALLNINGEEVIAKEGEKVEGFRIAKIANDSIQLKLEKGRSYWVRKKIDD
ncbi:MAG: hypothetical protein LW832_00625 [Parachlamydia sp.]|nr:hypothetical protein [Parachlamydia sp.]